MVRPNQIISLDSEANTFEFILFARSKKTARRRALLVNFPPVYVKNVVLGDSTVGDYITDVRVISEGLINRYAVTIQL